MIYFSKTTLQAGLLAMALGMAGSAQAAILYTVVDLGTLPGKNDSTGRAINATGQVAGGSDLRAFRRSGGVMSDLGTLGGNTAIGLGINDAGQVTGGSQTVGNMSVHAFIYIRRVFLDIGKGLGTDINNLGQVTGVGDFGGPAHAFLYSAGAMKDLGTLGGGFSQGNAINDSGQVTGSSLNSANSTRAFHYSGGVMSDLGTLGGRNSEGFGINAAGQVVGSAENSDGFHHAFLYSGGLMTDLGVLEGNYSEARGINSAGQVVGRSYAADGAFRAFISFGCVMTPLDTLVAPGWTFSDANAINDAGQITGVAKVGGVDHAFLLTPIRRRPLPRGKVDCGLRLGR